MSWADVKFAMEDLDRQMRLLIQQTRRQRESDDPREQNQWMGDIIDHLEAIAYDARSAYVKVGMAVE